LGLRLLILPDFEIGPFQLQIFALDFVLLESGAQFFI
jgi:hypothetical protein